MEPWNMWNNGYFTFSISKSASRGTIKGPLKPPEHHSTIVLMDLMGESIGFLDNQKLRKIACINCIEYSIWNISLILFSYIIKISKFMGKFILNSKDYGPSRRSENVQFRSIFWLVLVARIFAASIITNA